MIQRLLLLPGMDGTGELFADFMSSLPKSIRSEAPCYPTDVRLNYRDLEKLIMQLVPSSEPFVLLAESFSTPLAISYAASRPANLKALILCAGFAASPLRRWKRAMASALVPVLPFGHLPSYLIDRFLTGREASKDLSCKVKSAIKKVRPEVLRYCLQCVFACDERAAVSKISIPILYLRASEDRLVPRTASQEIASLKPETHVQEIPGPHLLLQANPKAAASAVLQFLESLDQGSSSAIR